MSYQERAGNSDSRDVQLCAIHFKDHDAPRVATYSVQLEMFRCILIKW